MKFVQPLLREFRGGRGLKGQLLRGGFWSLVIKLLSTLMALLTAVVLARVLGAEGFGVYSFILALVTILAIPAQMGLPNLVVRETARAQVAQQWDIMKGLWRWSTLTALGMSLALMTLGGAATWIFGQRLGELQMQTLWWGLLLVPLVALGNLRGAALRGLGKVVQGQLAEFVIRPMLLVGFLLLGAAWLFQGSLDAADAMKAHAIASAFAFVFGAWMLIRSRPPQLSSVKPKTRHKIWAKSSGPFALIAAIEVVNQSIGSIALGIISNPYETAQFKVAIQASLLVSLGLSTSKLVIAPHMAKFYAAQDMDRLQWVSVVNARISFMFALIASVALFFFGTDLIILFFGLDFSGATTPLLVLVAGQLLSTIFASSGVLLNMTGNEKSTAVASAIALSFNIVSTFILVPHFGALGAAISSGSALAIWYALMAARTQKILGIDSTLFGRSGASDPTRN